MGRSHQNEDITYSQRYECKYLLSPMLASSLRQFTRPFLRPDPFAEIRDGFRYPISSLYLDSDDLKLYKQTVNGDKNRFKLRVRTYSDDPTLPAYLEVKRKVNNIVRKRRARLDWPTTLAMLEKPGSVRPSDVPAGERDDFELFASHVNRVNAKPLIRVRYSREAYESIGGDPVRLTLDTDLAYAHSLTPCIDHSSGRWTSTPIDGVILEVKFTDSYPSWVPQMVRALGLKQQPVPKYVMCLDHLMQRDYATSVAGLSSPPRSA